MNLKFAAFILAFALSAVGKGMDWDALKPSVVRLVVIAQNKEDNATGTGFVVGADGNACLVVTNCHVVAERAQNDSIIVARKNGDHVEAYNGVVEWQDDHRDLAVVRVENLQSKPLTLHRSGPDQGDDVFALGFPGVVDDDASVDAFAEAVSNSTSHRIDDPTGQASRFVEATLSKASVRRVVEGNWDPGDPPPEFKIIEHDVNITGGNSGGPLLNGCGQVVGVNTQLNFDQLGVVRKSSHSSELISALDNLGIRYKSTSTPCTAAALAGQSVGGFWIPVFAILAAAGVGVALFVALKKPAFVRETYTQFLRRSPPPPPISPVSPPPIPVAAPPAPWVAPQAADSQGWLLEGENPETGQKVRIEVAGSMVGRGKLVLGRKEGLVHYHVKNTSISSQHATLLLDGTGLYLEDRNSSNGTRVNGNKLPPFSPVKLCAGDSVLLGDLVLRVSNA